MQSQVLSCSLTLAGPGLLKLGRRGSASLAVFPGSVSVTGPFSSGCLRRKLLNVGSVDHTKFHTGRCFSRKLVSPSASIVASPRKRCHPDDNAPWNALSPCRKRSRAAAPQAARGQAPRDVEEILVRVKQDDTLSELAETFHCSVQDWVAENPELEDQHKIYEGKYLRIPKDGWSGKTPRGYQGRIKIHRFPAEAVDATADEQARVSVEVAEVPAEGLTQSQVQFVSTSGEVRHHSRPQSGPWSERGLQVLLLGIVLIVGGLVGLLKRDMDKAKSEKAEARKQSSGRGGQVTLNPEGNLAPELQENAVAPTSVESLPRIVFSVKEVENTAIYENAVKAAAGLPTESASGTQQPVPASPVLISEPGDAESLNQREKLVKDDVGAPNSFDSDSENSGARDQREQLVKGDAGVPKNYETDSEKHVQEVYSKEVREASAIANAPSPDDDEEGPPPPSPPPPSSYAPPPPKPSAALPDNLAVTAAEKEFAPSSITPFFASIIGGLTGSRKPTEESATSSSKDSKLGAVGQPEQDKSSGVALAVPSDESSLVAAASKFVDPLDDPVPAPSSSEKPQALGAGVEPIAALPELATKSAGQRAFDNAVKAAIPAVAVGAGAAATLTSGYEGAFEVIGLTALASFAASDLVLAEKRRSLWKDLTSIRSHQQLINFLTNRNITPKV